MTIRIQTRKIIVQRPSARTIHPDMQMTNADFLRGYAMGLKEGLYPESGRTERLTDEDFIDSISTCLADDPGSLAYVLGNYLGLIIGKCH